MTNQFKTPPPFEPITIYCLDPILHGPWNGYYCMDITCPCARAPGRLSQRWHETGKQAVVEATPTVELERWVGPIPDVTEEETWRTEARQRRRITLWHTIKSKFRFKKG